MFEFCITRNKNCEREITELWKSFQSCASFDVQKIPLPLFRFNKYEKPEKYIENAQCYLNKLGYNYTGMQFFPINRNAPIVSFLTQEQEYFKRFTISFISEFNGNIFRHVVLGICLSSGLFGAIGLSRREDLMYKPLKYPSLSSLIYDYADAYHRHQHKLLKVKIGSPIPHRPYILEKIHWKGIVIPFKRGFYKSEINTLLDHYSRFLRGSTDILTKKNLHSILPNISSDSCTITKGKQPIPYNKAIRLSSVSDKTGQMTSSSVDSNKWICVTNLPVNNSLSEKSQMITNSYQIRI
ncbi:unnamed protein product [Heterobilharzia americana]|nr:unnamed protein product [Heterobilharzia americana]